MRFPEKDLKMIRRTVDLMQHRARQCIRATVPGRKIGSDEFTPDFGTAGIIENNFGQGAAGG